MTRKPYLIFDAGGVLVFPDFNLLADIANRVGIETSPLEITQEHAKLLRALDGHVAQHHRFPAIQYFLDIFKQVTESEERARAALELTLQADESRHIWATTQPWVGETLQKLAAQGYHMAVISNSDGRVDQILQDLNLREYFKIVIDSFVVGVEKPDSRIFEIAVQQLNWDPAETIYIGDVFYIDVWGANRSGLGAVHLDMMGLYTGWEGIHIPTINELPALLAKMDGNIHEWNLFPLRDFEMK